MKKTLILSLLLSAILLTTQSALCVVPAAVPEPNQPPKPQVPNDPNYVVATYNDQNLTLKQVRFFAPEADFDTVKNVAEFWLNTQLLHDEAVKKDVAKDEKTKLMADIAFKKSIASAYIEQVQKEVNISDEQIKKYYEDNKDTDPRLKEPAYLSFSHITTDTQEQAQAVRDRIDKGEEINELAKTLSVANDAKKGGKAAKFREETVRQRYGQEILDAFIASSEGQIIGPIKNKDGKYEVMRNEGKRAAKVLELEKVKDQIKTSLESQEKKNAVENLIKKLREDAKDKCKLNGVFGETEKSEKK
jgi:hypothetical protein